MTAHIDGLQVLNSVGVNEDEEGHINRAKQVHRWEVRDHGLEIADVPLVPDWGALEAYEWDAVEALAEQVVDVVGCRR